MICVTCYGTLVRSTERQPELGKQNHENWGQKTADPIILFGMESIINTDRLTVVLATCIEASRFNGYRSVVSSIDSTRLITQTLLVEEKPN